MADFPPVNDGTWLEFLGAPNDQSCYGLCGNSGIVDTRGKIKSPTGTDCGVRAYCICPNGRAIKWLGDGKLPPEEDPS